MPRSESSGCCQRQLTRLAWLSLLVLSAATCATKPIEGLTITGLPGAGSVEGVIVEWPSGAPVIGARIAGGGGEAYSDERGAFVLVAALGEPRVEVTADGLWAWQGALPVGPSPFRARIELVRRPGASFVGPGGGSIGAAADARVELPGGWAPEPAAVEALWLPPELTGSFPVGTFFRDEAGAIRVVRGHLWLEASVPLDLPATLRIRDPGEADPRAFAVRADGTLGAGAPPTSAADDWLAFAVTAPGGLAVAVPIPDPEVEGPTFVVASPGGGVATDAATGAPVELGAGGRLHLPAGLDLLVPPGGEAVVLHVSDGSVLALDPGASARLGGRDVAPQRHLALGETVTGSRITDVIYGCMRSWVKAPGKRLGSDRTKVKSITIGVRGTSFGACGCPDSTSAWLWVESGEVELRESDRTSIVRAGQMASRTATGEPRCDDGCDCAPGLASCNNDCEDGCETSLQSAAHCGSCAGAGVCVAGQECVEGECRCPVGTVNCGRGCEPESQDSCGSCGRSCQGEPRRECVAGQCLCPEGYTDCGDGVACGNPRCNGCQGCGPNAGCGTGGCYCLPKGAGAIMQMMNCNGTWNDGCESSDLSDTSCGGCGKVCPGETFCYPYHSPFGCLTPCPEGTWNCAYAPDSDTTCEFAASSYQECQTLTEGLCQCGSSYIFYP